jgi:nucleotide-binding universal stress UspA family protein
MLIPRDIVVYLDNTDASALRSRIAYAAALAQRWKAHVAAAFVPEDLLLNPHAAFAWGTTIRSLYESYERRKRDSEVLVRTLLDDSRVKFGISCELRLCDGEIGEALMLHARHATIAIVGPGPMPDRKVTGLTRSEEVIFASGRPSILLPSHWSSDRGTTKIVVGWNASREAARAISDAMPFLTAAEAVHVVVVPEPKNVRLLGEDPGADISRHLARYGVSVVLDQLEGEDAGELLLARAEDIDADMIVAGAYGQPRVAEFVFGSATQTLMSNPQMPILLSR